MNGVTTCHNVSGNVAIMSTELPAAYRDLLESEAHGTLATLMPDGLPHVTTVWIDHEDGQYALVNSARGRQKVVNLERNPAVGLCVVDPDDPYRYVSVVGRATLVDEGAVEHIDALAKRYVGVDEYPHHGTESGPRVVIRITPERVLTNG